MKAKNAKRNPILKIKLRAMMETINIPSSVNSHVRHAKRNELPPMVESALHKIGLPVKNTAC